ncbi:hypothetical protein ETR_16722 [Erwinia tracheiphila PSU-1]|nr:hypothetical protein ETR_16722 [Erwinia tracheiphila PSU-1]
MLNISLKKSVIKAIAPISGETSLFTIGPDNENHPNPLDTTSNSRQEKWLNIEQTAAALTVANTVNTGTITRS